MEIWTGAVAVLAWMLVIWLLWHNHRPRVQVQHAQTLSDLAQPTCFEYDLETHQMLGSSALADQYGGFSNSYLTMIQDNFPESAIEAGQIYDEDCPRYQDFYHRLRVGEKESGQIELRIRNDYTGTYMWSRVTMSVLPHWSGKPRKAVGVIQDLNYTDKLTGIDNKFKFEQDAQRLLGKSRGGYSFVLLDLKDFKLFNEINGYQQGDQLLRHMADVVRALTEPDELCAHAFSDRFYLLWKYEGRQQITARVEEVMERISCYDSAKRRYTIAAYAGIFLVNDGTIPINSIVDRARIAQLEVKSSRVENIAFFEEDIKNTLVRRQEIENSMESSLAEQMFQIYIQPKYRLATGQIAGGEALVRWVNGQHIILPGDFIPLFEQNGFITQLDIYIFDGVCRLLRQWIDSGLNPVPISVNFSRLHLYDADFAIKLDQIAKAHSVPSELLEIELTESVAFENEEIISQFIKELSDYGFHLSVDDFGSGYSSLAMLKDLDFSIIKLDRGFFGTGSDPTRTKVVVGNVIQLSHQLGITTVAEGVETKDDIELLQELGCDIVQGYYFARPMPVEDFTKKLALARLAVVTE